MSDTNQWRRHSSEEVVLVPDLSEALTIWRRNGVHVTMVTPDGDVIDAAGVITGGSERPVEEEIVSRQRLVDELAADILAAERNLTNQRSEIDRLTEELDAEHGALSKLDQETHALTLQVVAAEKDVERLADEIPRWIDRVEVIGFEVRSAATEEHEITIELGRIDAQLQSLTTRRRELDNLLSEASENSSAATLNLESLANALTAVRVRIAQRQQRLEAVVAAAQRLQTQRQEMVSRGAAQEAEQRQAIDEHRGLCVQLDEASERVAIQEADYSAADALLPEAQRCLDEVTETLHDGDTRARGLRDVIDEARRAAARRR
jgi:chromosome segregation protein